MVTRLCAWKDNVTTATDFGPNLTRGTYVVAKPHRNDFLVDLIIRRRETKEDENYNLFILNKVDLKDYGVTLI